MSEDCKVEAFIIPRDDDLDIKLSGWVISKQTSKVEGRARWHELTLYGTRSGTYVCSKIGVSTKPGELNRCSALIVERSEGETGIRQFFGHGALAKVLLLAVGMAEFDEID